MRFPGLFIAFALLVIASAQAGEPRPMIEVIVGDQKFRVEDGGSFNFKPSSTEAVRVAVHQLPSIHFSNTVVAFDYPRNYAYAHDSEPPESWELTGNDVVLSLFDFGDDEVEPEKFLHNVAKRLGTNDHCEPVTVTLETRGQPLQGKRCEVRRVSTITIFKEAYMLDVAGGHWMLVLQDTSSSKQSASEMAELKRKLAQTLEVKTP